jgi:hypothetical protein
MVCLSLCAWSHWHLTAKGRAMQVYNTVHDPIVFLKPRLDVALADMTAFELAYMLEETDSGWTCTLLPKSRRSKDTVCPVVPYELGGMKIWFLRPKAKTYQRLYMLALLSANSIKKPIEHCLGDRYYHCLINNIPFVKRDRHADSEFNFASGTSSRQSERSQIFPKRSRAMRVVAELQEDDDGAVDGELEEVASIVSGQADSASSDSSPSSSSSSSSSSRSMTTKGEVPGAAALPVPVPAATKDDKPLDWLLSSAATELPGRALRSTTTFFRDQFRITHTFHNDGTNIGIEAACPCHQRCKKRLTYTVCGGIDNTYQTIHFWCFMAKSTTSQPEHRDLPIPAILPTEHDMVTALMPVCDGYTPIMSKRRKVG